MRRSLLFFVTLFVALVLGYRFLQEGNNSADQQTTLSTAPKGIIFVTIDTLRADHLRNYGYFRSTAPFLEELMREGVLFENAFTACSHTAPSHASMFTSLYPFEHGVHRNHEVLDQKFVTLQQLARTAGYETAAFPSVAFMDGKVGFDQLPPSEDIPEATVSKRHWYRSADTQVDRVLHWFNKRQDPDKPFLVWLHFYDVHQWQGRGQLPPEYWDMMTPENPRELAEFLYTEHGIPRDFFSSEDELIKAIHGYDARLRFVDSQIERLNGHLKANAQTDSLLWLITSDHGEGLGNHHYEGHGKYIYQEQLHVPLIVHSTAHKFSPARIDNLVRTVDLLPTLLEIFAGPVPEQIPFQGRSLLPLLEGRADPELHFLQAFAQRRPKDESKLRSDWEDGVVQSIFDLEHKLIYSSQGNHEYYFLEEDPLESTNRFATDQSGIIPDLQQDLSELRSGQLESPLEESTAEQKLNQEMIEELKALGYL